MDVVTSGRWVTGQDLCLIGGWARDNGESRTTLWLLGQAMGWVFGLLVAKDEAPARREGPRAGARSALWGG